MDIQKEREAFEQHLTDTGLVEFSDYGFAVDECDEYLHEPTQVAWDSWLIGMNRAKAQAVPKGFAVVPKTIPENVVERLKNSSYHWGENTKDYFSPIYKMMVEEAARGGNE